MLLPGLVQAAALPAVAVARDLTTATTQGALDIPRQQMGVGRQGLPSLVPAETTRAPDKAQSEIASGKVRLPRQMSAPDAAPRTQSRLRVERQLPSGTARAEAQDVAAAAGPAVKDMWPLNGARSVSASPTLLAHAEGGSAPYRYEFTVCEAPEEDAKVTYQYEYDLWCVRQKPDGSWYVPPWSGQLAPGVNSWKIPVGELEWGATYAWKVTVTDAAGAEVTSAYRTFVTGVRQPLIGSLLATRDQGGQEFQAVSGNYTTTVADASVASAGPALSVVRTYNSMDARRDGLFGAGWSTRFDMRVVAESGASLLVTYPDGRRLRFAQKGDGTFQPPPGMHASLAALPGGGWKLMDKTSTVYHFNAQGRLTRVVDARGRAQELAYGSDGKLATVTGAGGRSLTFVWNGAHVGSVSTDAVDGAPLTWTYTYDGDKLATACSPGLAPKCTTYGYSTGSQYRGLVQDDEPLGYWRLGDPYTAPAPTPTPTNPMCEINPILCGPQEPAQIRDLGWGAGPAGYSGLTLQQPGALAGTTDTAAGFTGESSMELPDSVMARLQDQLSLELWFKTTSSGVLAYTAAQRPPSVPSLAPAGTPVLYVGTDGKLRGQFRTLTSTGVEIATPITSPAAVNNGQWHHAVLSGAGNSQTLYLDGAAVGSLTGKIDHNWMAYTSIGHGLTNPGWPASKPLGSGDYFFTRWGFVGHIDEVSLYDRALGAADVGTHYTARVAAPHLLSKITLPSGRIWADNTYDAGKDRLLTHTDEHGGLWKIAEPSRIDRETGSSVVTVTDPAGKDSTFEHDAWRGYRTIAHTDQAGFKTTVEYDARGFPLLVKDPNGVVTLTGHDDRGNLRYSVQCRADNAEGLPLACFGFPSPGEPAAFNHRWWSFHVNDDDPFDPRNDRLTAFRDGRSSSGTDNTYATTYEYNSYGEQTKQTTPATLDFPNGRSATVTYTDGTEPAVGGGTTPAGLIKTRSDAKNNTTTFGYSAAGDLAEQIDPNGLITKREHDALGRLISQTQISDAQPTGVKTTFTYDGTGRLATQTSPGVKNEITDVTHTAQTSYTYDPDGNTLTATTKDLTGGDAERQSVYTYDAYGHEETTTDAEGGVVRTTWNKLGLQDTVTDQVGAVFGYAYTERGQLAARTLKNWTGSPVSPQPAAEITLESYSYDPAGRLAAQVDAMGRKTSYQYYDHGLPYRVIGDDVKLNGSTTPTDVVLQENTYDAADNLTKQVHGGGITATEYVYDAAGRLSSATLDPAKLQRKTVFEYDANDQTVKETYTGAAGGTRAESVSYGYNAAGVLTRQTVENGDEDLTTTWAVDDRGLAVSTTDPRGNAAGATAADYTTTNSYDALGRLIEIKAPTVAIEKAGNAQQGRPTTRIGYNNAGWQTHVIDPEGRLATTGFDRMGRRTSLTAMPYTPPGGTQVTPTMGYGYDAAGRLTTVTDPRGQVATTEYDALGNPVRVTDPPAAAGQPAGQWISEYNRVGEQLTAIDPTGARVQATYDDLGRQITQTVIERKPASAAYVTTLTYNDAGYLTKEVLPGNKTTDFVVNAAGEVESVTDPAREITKYSYDALGRPAKTTDPLDNAMVGEYDLAGRLTSVKSLDKNGATVRTVGLGYDAAGNATRYTSGEGHVTRRSYDATDLLTELVEPVSDSEQITTSFGYDATGARTRLTDGRGNATWTGYNTLGLIDTLTEPATTAHPALADRTWTHVYDVAGNETALIQPGGVRHDKQYDNLNRLTKVSGSGAGIVADDKTYSYDLADRPTTVSGNTLEYNDRSLLTKLTTPTGTSTAYAYDALGNPTQRIDVTGTTTYTWDADSRLKTVADPVSGRTNTYDYDKADRLTTITSANPANTQAFTYDALDRVETHTLKNSSGGQLSKITYGWDKDDNLTSKATEGLAGAGSNTYGYDHAGRLTSWTGPDGTTTAYGWDAAGNRTKAGDKTFTYDERNRLLEGDGSNYTYTPRGTLATQTKNGNTRTLTFDAFDRLINDGDATYTYDAFDRMLTRQKNGGTQRFAYAGLDNDIIAITDQAGAVQSSYGRDPFGGLISVKEGAAPATGALTDLHQDLVGTFTGTALSSTTTYNPFGEVTAQTGTEPTLGYQGEYTDPDTGKVNMHARWYQPGTGAFTSRDTWTLEPSPSARMNRYSYGQATPLTYADPSGHRPDPVEDLWCQYKFGASCVSDDGPWGDCKDQYGNTGPCGGSSGSGGGPDKDKGKDGHGGSGKGKSSHPNASSTPNAAPKPPPVYNPPPVAHPTGGGPKEDPCAVLCYVPVDRPNCGKKCMVEPRPAADDEEPRTPIIPIGDGDLAPLEGFDPNDGADFVPTRDRPTTEPVADTEPAPAPDPGDPPPGGGPEPDCAPFKENYLDPRDGRPTGGVARFCNRSDLDGGSDASVDPKYWPSANPKLPNSGAYTYNRCHIIANKMGGTGKEAKNLVPCLSVVNNGPMKSRERRVINEVKKANGRGVVDYRVTVFYKGQNKMPDRFRMEASLDGVGFLDDCVHNDMSKTVTSGSTCI
ncbi:RHS repeat-associated core domain-containing protein [Nonomuraea sp. PA05]|uniref:RHS repeat-associated core domain-containing protein n=1 Tax=Nonomuraea sp. PA05 TaxID=2604466 RepID=UPI0021CC7F0F|nr:RHS repeat-associated core domain-containing protein [Nonomuraea sp. PA05]